MANSYFKDPDAVLDYVWDWDAWLGSDTISSHSIIAESGITVDSSSTTTTVVTAWLSGGTVNTDYNVVCRIVTAGGRTDDRTSVIRIRSK